MARPVLLIVDDNHRRREALCAQLRSRYEPEYQILAEESSVPALETLSALMERAEPVAVVVAAEQLVDRAGVDFLEQLHRVEPKTRRVLLIDRGDYTSANPAVQAMILGRIDYHLFVPWLPADRFLYPVIDQFLADWSKTQPPSFEEIRIVGSQREQRSREMRDRLARVGVPYGFYDADTAEGRSILQEVAADGARLPVVVLHTGQVLINPSTPQMAEALGARTRLNEIHECDLAIAGAGPAGLAAAVYAASEGLRTLVVEPEVPGGQAGTSALVRNYLGFPHGVTGDDLGYRAFEQAWLFGADFLLGHAVTRLRKRGDNHIVQLSDGSDVTAGTVIIATGVSWRRLGVPRLEDLHGEGVFYGAGGAEARAMQGQHVCVIGAGNSAGQAAVNLARYANQVTMLVRGETLSSSMSDYLVREISNTRNIAVRLGTEVVDGYGNGRLERLVLTDKHRASTEQIDVSALFILIGAEPHTDWLGDTVQRDDKGFILTGQDLISLGTHPTAWPLARPPMLLETSSPGVFAIGDTRRGSVKRVASAVGEGAVAVRLVYEYLEAQRVERISDG